MVTPAVMGMESTSVFHVLPSINVGSVSWETRHATQVNCYSVMKLQGHLMAWIPATTAWINSEPELRIGKVFYYHILGLNFTYYLTFCII